MSEKKRTATITISDRCYEVIEKFAKSRGTSFSETVELLSTVGCGTIVEAFNQANNTPKEEVKKEPTLTVEK